MKIVLIISIKLKILPNRLLLSKFYIFYASHLDKQLMCVFAKAYQFSTIELVNISTNRISNFLNGSGVFKS